MTKVTVWEFDAPRIPANFPGLRARATQAAIDEAGYTRREGTDLQVDERFLNDGFTRRDYVTFRVRILHSDAFAGFDSGRQRLKVMAGEYEARLTLREFDAIVGAVECLQLVGADTRGGDLWIKESEFDELATFPDEVNPLHIEVLDWRVTEPDEL